VEKAIATIECSVRRVGNGVGNEKGTVKGKLWKSPQGNMRNENKQFKPSEENRFTVQRNAAKVNK
jgi:hypothetical protein